MKIIRILTALAMLVVASVASCMMWPKQPPSPKTGFSHEKCIAPLRAIGIAQKLWFSVRGEYAQEYSDICFEPLNPADSTYSGHNLQRSIAVASANKTDFPDGSTRSPFMDMAVFKSLPVSKDAFLVVALPAVMSDKQTIITVAVSSTRTEPYELVVQAADLDNPGALRNSIEKQNK